MGTIASFLNVGLIDLCKPNYASYDREANPKIIVVRLALHLPSFRAVRARHGLIKSVALSAFIQGQLKIDKQSRHDRDECIPRVFFSTYSRDKPIRQPIPSLCHSLVMWLEQVGWTMCFLSKWSCLHVVSTICMCQGKERVPWSTSLKLVNGHLFLIEQSLQSRTRHEAS